MKKSIGIAFAVLAALMIGAPLVNGILMERVVRKVHQQANRQYQESGSDVQLAISRYDRGYLSSEIEWRLTLGRLAALYGVDEIVFVDRAKHQLTGIVSETSLEKNQWYQDLVAQHLGGVDPLHITTRYLLNGAVESTIALDATALTVEGEQISVGPGQVVVSSDSDFSAFHSEGRLQEMNGGDEVVLRDLSLSSTLTKESTYIWAGDLQIAVGSGRLSEAGETVDLQNLRAGYRLDFDREGSRVTLATTLAADRFGSSEFTVENPTFRIEAANLDAAGYERYLAAYSDLAGEVMDDISRPDMDQEARQQVVKNTMTMAGIRLLAAGEQLLKKDTRITVSELSARLPEGEINGTLTFQLLDDLTLMQLAPLADQPSLAFRLFSLQSSLRLPQALVDDPAPLVTPMHPAMPTGFFRREGETLVHEAETRDGNLYLNGQQVVLD